MLHFAHCSGNVRHNFRCIPFMCWEEMCLVNDNALVHNLCSSAPCYVPSSTASKCECAWVRKNKFLTEAVQLKAQNVDNSSSSLPKHIMANSSSIADRTSRIRLIDSRRHCPTTEATQLYLKQEQCVSKVCQRIKLCGQSAAQGPCGFASGVYFSVSSNVHWC